MSQAEVVTALADLGARWRDPGYPPRRRAEALTDPFPFAMTRVSLDALLDSLRQEALWALIDAEGARDAFGPPVIGHVIAGNTPLLAWVSVIRALLVRSASFVKLPSGGAAEWGTLFAESLTDVAPALSEAVHWAQWPGGTTESDTALCRKVDLVVAHGSDATLDSLRALCPETPLLGYGHRVSFGLVLLGGGTDEAADGLAADVLLYDQGGCLSPQTIFVEGGWNEATAFARRLVRALPPAAARYPLSARPPQAAMRVREARALAHMESDTVVWADSDLRWTVVARPQTEFAPSPTHGVVSVQPLPSVDDLPGAVAPVAAYLQGCALAAAPEGWRPEEVKATLASLGVSYVCSPGWMQAPPLSWRQDGRDVLRSLLPG